MERETDRETDTEPVRERERGKARGREAVTDALLVKASVTALCGLMLDTAGAGGYHTTV
jgi:hypothetical protein